MHCMVFQRGVEVGWASFDGYCGGLYLVKTNQFFFS